MAYILLQSSNFYTNLTLPPHSTILREFLRNKRHKSKKISVAPQKKSPTKTKSFQSSSSSKSKTTFIHQLATRRAVNPPKSDYPIESPQLPPLNQITTHPPPRLSSISLILSMSRPRQRILIRARHENSFHVPRHQMDDHRGPSGPCAAPRQ